MKIAVINTGGHDQVLRRTVNTREWEAYKENSRDICEALCALGHEVINFSDGKDVINHLEQNQVNAAWICSGGIQGRNSISHLPAILEMLGICYVGPPPLAAAMADHKPAAKKIVAFSDVLTPAFQIFHTPSDELHRDLEFPLMVKPSTGMCSCGIYRVDTEQDLRLRVKEVMDRYHSSVLVEKFIPGRNLSVPVTDAGDLGVLPIIERYFYSLDDPKGQSMEAVATHPRSTMTERGRVATSLPEGIEETLETESIKIFESLELGSIARIDFQLGEDNNVYFLEANPKPDLCKDSLISRAAAAEGIEYIELIKILLEGTLNDYPSHG